MRVWKVGNFDLDMDSVIMIGPIELSESENKFYNVYFTGDMNTRLHVFCEEGEEYGTAFMPREQFIRSWKNNV